MLTGQNRRSPARAADIFHALDRDSSGAIDRAEFELGLGHLGLGLSARQVCRSTAGYSNLMDKSVLFSFKQPIE